MGAILHPLEAATTSVMHVLYNGKPHISGGVVGPVACVAWHPYSTLVAIALQDNSIHFFDVHKQEFMSLILEHEFQSNVRKLVWRPYACHTLAVACRYGVCMWRLGQQFHGKEQRKALQAATMMYLHVNGHSDLSDLSWSPDGRIL